MNQPQKQPLHIPYGAITFVDPSLWKSLSDLCVSLTGVSCSFNYQLVCRQRSITPVQLYLQLFTVVKQHKLIRFSPDSLLLCLSYHVFFFVFFVIFNLISVSSCLFFPWWHDTTFFFKLWKQSVCAEQSRYKTRIAGKLHEKQTSTTHDVSHRSSVAETPAAVAAAAAYELSRIHSPKLTTVKRR